VELETGSVKGAPVILTPEQKFLRFRSHIEAHFQTEFDQAQSIHEIENARYNMESVRTTTGMEELLEELLEEHTMEWILRKFSEIQS